MKTKEIVRDFSYRQCGPEAIVDAVRDIAAGKAKKATFALCGHPNHVGTKDAIVVTFGLELDGPRGTSWRWAGERDKLDSSGSHRMYPVGLEVDGPTVEDSIPGAVATATCVLAREAMTLQEWYREKGIYTGVHIFRQPEAW
jgi:hypothetical protein